jgi:hypothetical protein
MALRKRGAAPTNAQHQARWRERNLISLAADAREIANRLVAMDDQAKLAQIVIFLNRKLNPTDGRCGFVKDDGGRSRSGIAYGGKDDRVGDCVARAIAIATQRPYREVHDALTLATVRYVASAESEKSDWGRWARRKGGVRAFHADHGVVNVVSGPYLKSLGWKYTSTKELPRGKGVHLRADELPPGRLIVDIHRHLCAVINGVIHDTFDCSNEGRCRIRGYWSKA